MIESMCNSRGRWKSLLVAVMAGILLFCVSASGESTFFTDDGYDAGNGQTEYSDEGNLLYNGTFELIDEDGLPEGWYTDEYHIGSGITVFSVPQDDDPDRGRVVEIWNTSDNDARFYQVVPVDPDTVYCLSGYIRAEGIRNGHGANFSIEDVYTFSSRVFDTADNWEYVEYYGITGPDQDLLTVFVRLGGYGGESTGKARFDNIRLTAVQDNPETENIANWFIPDEYGSSGSEPDDEETGFRNVQVESENNARVFLILTGAGWLALFLIFAAFFKGRRKGHALLPGKEKLYFVPILILAFAARLVISYYVKGYMVDVNCFTSWGGTMDIYGPLKFYEKTSYCDYPPLYTYILSLNSVIVRWCDASEAWTRVIFRFVPSVCDILSCYMLYQYAREKMPGQIHRVCVILVFFAMNPAVMLNSAAWGQIDSVLCLMMLMVVLFAVKGKWQAALPVYAVSVLLKPQALMLGILGLVYIAMTWIRQKESRKPILIGVLTAVLCMAAVILPFSALQSEGLGWLIDKYKETLESYPYATVNSANLYYLLGGNWEKIELPCNSGGPVILAAACVAFAMWWHIKYKNKRYSWIESILACDFAFLFIILAVMRMSWGTVGTVAMVFAFVITISFAVRKGNISFLPYLGALLFILLYVFGVKMHERYIFPALFLLAAAWVIQRDRRILYILGIFSVTLFLNEGIVLDNSIRLGASYGHLLSDTVAIADILSFLNIGGAVYAVCIGASMISSDGPTESASAESVLSPERIAGKKSPLDYHPDRSMHWNTKDWWILSAVTVVYSVICLTTLGSAKAPQTGWTSGNSTDRIVFDLGENHEPAAVLYFGRVSDSYQSDFAFSESADGLNWSEDVYAQMNQGECWKWKYVVTSYGTGTTRTYNQSLSGIRYFTERYIRLDAKHAGLRLNEIIFRDRYGNALEAEIVSDPSDEKPDEMTAGQRNLLDEQDTLEALPDLVDGHNGDNAGAQPSWWNSTYFDEIYHARTAFEFLHPDEINHTPGYQAEPYENSHPPLGKLLMSLFIAVFGMTPFGWRFAGALAGIMMIPGMYLIGKQLTKKTSIASLAAVLMALDCMHLTQTQIATIDSFPVLFIIFSYYFMLRYIQTDIVREKLSRSLVPLLFSGLFMGLSIASKWIGIYAGAGLAVLFVWHGFRMIRISRQAKTMMDSASVSPQEREWLQIYAGYGQNGSLPVTSRLFTICHWCLLFFIAIPAGIYLLSYIPYMAARTDLHTFPDFVTAVWNSQLHMLNYHSQPGLGMDHPFYSPWYEWPVMAKPMYYAARQYLNVRTTVPFSIFSFGNPVVWWTAIPALAYCIIRWFGSHFYQIQPGYELPYSRKKLFRPEISLSCHLDAKTYDNRISFVLIGLLAQYLPWVLVPRGTYIYHYFASVPFMILCIALSFDEHPDRQRNAWRVAGILLVLCALASFIIFFPYASGLAVPASWLNIGKKVLNIYY